MFYLLALASALITLGADRPAPTPYQLVVPWTNLALILLVPLLAMLGAGLLTRSRLPAEQRRPT
ncbi:hypothetical protein [Actinoplanes solisilvae]|uniref:hypothetical protein n=1 Tax=Actinoplanes solisilvae TaxID=2486853 RepID=UPI000FD7F47A|nr:hypothetical protein [Actinoplanes solisilvae]